LSDQALSRHNGVFMLRVRLQPHASMDRLEGLAKDAAGRCYVKARVRAVPEKGKANTALEKLIAKAIHVPRSAVRVVKGTTERVKTVRIDHPGNAVEIALKSLLKETPS
jgi:uncharacterized protein